MRTSARWLVLALIAICGVSLGATARANAADCMSDEECFNSAIWLQGATDQLIKQGNLLKALAQKEFGDAYTWHQRASLYLLAGQGSNAQWAQATADASAKQAVIHSKAADDRFRQAFMTGGQANTSFNRGLFFSALDGDDGGEISIAGRKYSKTCVPKKAKHPSIRWIPGCIHRRILRASSPAGVAAVSSVAFQTCVAGHLSARAQPPAGALLSLATAQAWCSKWRWGWVIVHT